MIAEGFLARLGFSMITFALPFYALSLGMSYTEVGILAALRLVGAIAFKPMMGRAADRLGKKRVYLWSIAGRMLVGVMFAVAATPLALFAIRFFHGLTTAARDPASAVLIAEHADERRTATAFAWYATAREVGAVLGFLVAGVLLTWTADNYALLFALSAVISALAFVLVAWAVREPQLPEKVESEDAGTNKATTPISRRAWAEYILLGATIALSGGMITQLFPIIAAEFAGLSKAEISVLYALATVVVTVAGPVFGWLSDQVSRKLVLSLRSVANALSSVVYALWPSFAGFATAKVLDEAGKAAFRPAWGALIAQASLAGDRKTRTARIAYLDNAQSVGEAIGPVLAGLVWDLWGVYWLFALRFVLALVAEGMVLLIARRGGPA